MQVAGGLAALVVVEELEDVVPGRQDIVRHRQGELLDHLATDALAGAPLDRAAVEEGEPDHHGGRQRRPDEKRREQAYARQHSALSPYGAAVELVQKGRGRAVAGQRTPQQARRGAVENTHLVVPALLIQHLGEEGEDAAGARLRAAEAALQAPDVGAQQIAPARYRSGGIRRACVCGTGTLVAGDRTSAALAAAWFLPLRGSVPSKTRTLRPLR